MRRILRVAIPVPLDRLFDYLPPDGADLDLLERGSRVRVPFGRHKKVGFLVEVVRQPECDVDKLKKADHLLDEKSLLGSSDMDMLCWASRYYHHPLGEVISAAFPILLRRGRPAETVAGKVVRMTERGRAIDPADLSRAPRQRALLASIAPHPAGLSLGHLAGLDWDWRGALRALAKRGWVEVADAPGFCDSNPSPRAAAPFTPNPAQRAAVETVAGSFGTFSVFLLEGVTGSGKTEVYLQLIESLLRRGLQTMVLLPEISLTPQIEARFRARFPVPIAVSHSSLSEGERLDAWLKVRRGEALILLGTRSAVFTPMARPGLIILDEEHDASFKQQEGFRFSARDIAIVRARNHGIPVLLGTATPSLETLLNVEKGRFQRLHLPERAGHAQAPTLRLLDIRNRKLLEGLAPPLIREMERTLAQGEQVLLFLNRRGFAPTLICHGCGWVARCRRCDANLVVHFDERRLRCHHCGADQRLAETCGQCGTSDLRPLGLGTERVEMALKRLFPGAVAARIDRDTTRLKGSLEKVLEDITAGKVNLLLGTQMLAKGHHFPGVTLVGILDVDAGLFSTDFHAAERLAQMIVQVAGRSGRADKPGRVVLQTRHPDHPLLLSLIHEGYASFARGALAERRAARLPPYSHMGLFRARATDKAAPVCFLEHLADVARRAGAARTEVLGPVPAPMTRRAGRYHFQLLIQCARRDMLHGLLDHLVAAASTSKEAKRVRWSLDVDPIDLY